MAEMVKWILLVLVLVAECEGDAVIEKGDNFDIEFDEKVVCKVNRKFVSVAFSAGQLNKTDHGYRASNTKLQNLLKGLAPAYVRVGGTRANFIEFEPRSEDGEEESSRIGSCSYTPDEPEEDKKGKKKGKKGKNRKGRGMKRRGKKRPKGDSEDDEDPEDPEEAEDAELTDKEKEQARKERKVAHRAMKAKKFAAYRNYKITADQFDDLYKLINGTGNTMLFDINAFARVPNTDNWDPKNAEKLLQYAQMKGYNVDWQFGNEPNHYYKFGACEQTGEEVGNDYVIFKKLVDANMPKAKIIGPDITQPKEGKKGSKVRAWLEGFLKTGGKSIDALAWHHYYVDGKEAIEDEFVNATIMDTFDGKNKQMRTMAMKYDFTGPIWLTESGTAWGGGAPNLSDRYGGMFLYIDKLGVAAINCMDGIARQAFLDGQYAMVDKATLNPHPEYYAAALFKKLGKNDVIAVQTTNKKDKNFRAYARCARGAKDGAIFLYIINLSKAPKTFAFPAYESVNVKQYLFTADSLQSDVVLLNGKPLEMDGDELPRMKGVDVELPVKIPGRSIGYYTVEVDSLNICK